MRLAAAAGWASRRAGRGKGAMIGGVIALRVDGSIMGQLSAGKRMLLITGTNGKSTTNRMAAAALSAIGPVVTNADGANMDAGLVAALGERADAPTASLEVDELHVPHAADATDPAAIVLLNLSHDQLDRVGEITSVERRLRKGLSRHPDAVLVANCDDVLVTSVAFDAPHVVWVAAGAGWTNDSPGCPRCGEPIVRGSAGPHPEWHCSSCRLRRPVPAWSVDGDALTGPDGFAGTLDLQVPGRANRGNASHAIAAAVALGCEPHRAVEAAGTVADVAGRYRTVRRGGRTIRLLLAKNPAGWQEALSMAAASAGRDASIVIAVNGRQGDGEDLSWLWDVDFESLAGRPRTVVAAGERGTDLSVRLTYAGVAHDHEPDALRAVDRCPPGDVAVLANYTALADLDRALERSGQ